MMAQRADPGRERRWQDRGLTRERVGEHGLSIRPAELAMLLDGIDLAHARRGKRYRRPPQAGV